MFGVAMFGVGINIRAERQRASMFLCYSRNNRRGKSRTPRRRGVTRIQKASSFASPTLVDIFMSLSAICLENESRKRWNKDVSIKDKNGFNMLCLRLGKEAVTWAAHSLNMIRMKC